MKINKTSYAVLGMLSIGPMSGYEIQQVMKNSTDNFWSESDGQLYPALNSLAKLKLITHKASKKTDRREKKIYALTALGKSELKKWLAQAAETQLIRNELILKLFFGANVSPEINIEHIQALRYQLKTGLEKIAATKQYITQEYPDSPHLPYWLMTIDHGILISEAKLTWCNQILKTLNKLEETVA